MATNGTTIQTPSTDAEAQSGNLDLLSVRLFRVVSCILVFVACLLVAGLIIQSVSYWGGLSAAVAGPAKNAMVDHSAVITYARGLGAAFIKTSALFFGFILIFTGSLYVLRTAQAVYEIHLATGATQGYLQTSSPGLVIVTLGVVLTIVALITKTDLSYERTTVPDQPSIQTATPSNTPGDEGWLPANQSPSAATPPPSKGTQ